MIVDKITMLFDFDVVVPARTPENSPVIQHIKLTAGTLTRIAVFFPPGPATLVYVTVSESIHQLAPANPGGTINLDDATWSSNLEYDFNESPFELVVRAWSPNAVYQHTITILCDVQPKPADKWSQFLQQLFEGQNAG